MSPIIENDSNLTPGEKFVKKAWPEAIFPGSIQDDAFTSVKNKVILKPEWQLIRADSEVFLKLSNIQNALQMALIPYHLWSQRVIMDMSGDFHGVRVWAMGKHPTWILLLEAIFATMQRLNVLHSPLTTFSLLSPKNNESPQAFTWRLRDAYYNLSGTDRTSDSTRDLLKELVQTNLPRTWTLAFPHTFSSNNQEIVEMVVQFSSQIMKWPLEDKMTRNSHINTLDNIGPVDLPTIETPSFKTSENEVVEEETYVSNEDICYACGKKGHWANKCPHYQNQHNRQNINKNNGKKFYKF
ncbi:hypothetical protein EV44_g3373 [Erysiphe necator]|uniref:CCHC-type domain-containing protein n=1 Tax=Uncinula necator TaxID=52586 RepID=A0A0B1PBA7_UNCNE|nr:hypothetical protein EV44_g3373 [Erysiphe necator]